MPVGILPRGHPTGNTLSHPTPTELGVYLRTAASHARTMHKNAETGESLAALVADAPAPGPGSRCDWSSIRVPTEAETGTKPSPFRLS